MEFRFSLENIFPQPIVKINNNLLPHTFRGDRRTALDTSTKISEIINTMGEYSAKAQGLAKPVTTAQKLRMSDQIIYLLGDPSEGKTGAVIGLLKVGKKSLYVFDENGETKMVNAPCVLDFYVHESRQRAGLGKDLFETMLEEEKFIPEKMAVDRPSDKLLGFLKKHYNLQKTIPQMNNFVVFEGFFDKPSINNNNQEIEGGVHITDSPNTALFGPQFTNEESRKLKLQPKASPTGMPQIQSSPVGRYAAPRPMCSMAEIIHNNATAATGEPNSEASSQKAADEQSEEASSLSVEIENLHVDDNLIEEPEESTTDQIDLPEQLDQPTNGLTHEDIQQGGDESDAPKDDHDAQSITDAEHIKKPTFVNKQHTGLKNLSYNVGMAVTPTNKMEFDQEQPESFGVVKINRPIGKASPTDNTDAESHVSSEGYTDQGYLDLKFYHNRLW